MDKAITRHRDSTYSLRLTAAELRVLARLLTNGRIRAEQYGERAAQNGLSFSGFAVEAAEYTGILRKIPGVFHS